MQKAKHSAEDNQSIDPMIAPTICTLGYNVMQNSKLQGRVRDSKQIPLEDVPEQNCDWKAPSRLRQLRRAHPHNMGLNKSFLGSCIECLSPSKLFFYVRVRSPSLPTYVLGTRIPYKFMTITSRSFKSYLYFMLRVYCTNQFDA